MRSAPSLMVLLNGLRSPIGRSHAALVSAVRGQREGQSGGLSSCGDDALHTHRLPPPTPSPHPSPVATKTASLRQGAPATLPPLCCADKGRL